MLPTVFGENLFDDFFDDSFGMMNARNPLYGKHARNLMKTDIRETDTNYELAIDLPGFKKDEIHIELKNGYLTISAAKGLDKDEKGPRRQVYPPGALHRRLQPQLLCWHRPAAQGCQRQVHRWHPGVDLPEGSSQEGT